MEPTIINVEITATDKELQKIFVDPISGCKMVAWDWGYESAEFGECAKVEEQYDDANYWEIPIKYLRKIEEGEV